MVVAEDTRIDMVCKVEGEAPIAALSPAEAVVGNSCWSWCAKPIKIKQLKRMWGKTQSVEGQTGRQSDI